jgi:hypothetical protein
MRLPAGASHPANFAEAFAVNDVVFADAVGKVTKVGTHGTTAGEIGVVTGVTNPQVQGLVLRIKLSI